MIPRYRIHISPLKKLLYRQEAACDQDHSAAILCSSDFSPITGHIPFKYSIQLEFQDTHDPSNCNSFRPEQAEAIKRFLSELPDGITDLFIACDAGSSRSPAIAAALFRASRRSDKAIWINPRNYPNPLVYKTLCSAFHLITPKLLVDCKLRANRRAYRKKQQSKA